MSTEHDRIRQALAEVSRRSLAELGQAVVPRAGPLPPPTPVPPARPKQPAKPALSDECARVLESVIRSPELFIDERAEALGMDRNEEGRARGFLLKTGYIAKLGSISKWAVFGPTDKGKDWARERGVPIGKEDTGTFHEVLCRRATRALARDVEGARFLRPGAVGDVLPDRLALLPDGLRIAIQVSVANTPAYEAERLVRLARDPTVDGAVLVAATRAKAGLVHRALEALAAGHEATGDGAAGELATADPPRPLGATSELRATLHAKIRITDAAAIEKRQFRWADAVARWRAARQDARDVQ